MAPVPVLISRCLLGECCRYDGRAKPSILGNLQAAGLHMENVQWIPVCPEVDGGLSVPRSPGEIEPGATSEAVLNGRGRVLTRSGCDVSRFYVAGAHAALSAAEASNAKTALLKARSPACGTQSIYDGTFTRTLTPGLGVAAQHLARAGVALFSEETLSSFVQHIRSNFEKPGHQV